MIPGVIANKKGTLLECAVQYNVTGALDGTEVAPTAVGKPIDEDGVTQIDVDNLGIIDPDLLGGIASRADRFVIWMRVEAPTLFAPGFRISRVNASQAVPSLGIIELQRITPASIIGTTRMFTTTECFTIPQGQAIQIIGGADAPAGSPYRVSLGIRLAASADDEARLASACCCQVGLAEGGGGGGGAVALVRDVESFSSQSFSTSGADDGTYFGYGAYYFSPTPLTFMQQSNAIFNNEEGIVSPAAIKLAIRGGSVTNIAIRSTVAFTGQPFIEISTGVGAFVRTFLTAAPQVFAANTTTIVACTGGAFAAADRIRVGINITTEVLLADIFVEVEITFED